MTVLRHLDPPVDWDELPAGSRARRRCDPAEREAVRHGPASTPPTPCCSARPTAPRRASLHMRWGRRTYANVRPVRWRPGYRSPLARPEGIDYVIVRENLEDAYVGIMGDAAALRDSGLIGPQARLVNEGEGRYAAKVITRAGTEQVGPLLLRAGPAPPRAGPSGQAHRVGQDEHAAQDRPLVLRHRGRESASDYPDVALEQFIVDDMAHRLVLRPRRPRRAAAAQPLRRRAQRRGGGDDRRPRAGAVGLLRRRLRLLRVGPRHGARHRRPATASTRRPRCSAR